jgi:transcription initiation factor IIE alpha subunit
MYVFIESSPLAVIPLDYNEYLKYSELRRTFGYSIDGINQPGWNADDIIRVLKELYQDKAWMVYDDKDATLYLWNVNFKDIPDWILEKVNPHKVKVLKLPASLDAEKSLFTLLAQKNYVSQ